MRHHDVAALLLALIGAGCASPPAEQSATAAKPRECQREYRVGSNLPVKDCAAPATDEERQRTIEDARGLVRPAGTIPRPGAGG